MRVVRNLVVGAGPAGLQLAHSLGRVGQEYLVLERGEHPGSFFDHYPRHRRLLSINKRHTGHPDLESRRRYDWNSLVCDDEALQFPRFTRAYFPDADELVRYLGQFAERYALHIEYGRTITRIERGGPGFHATTADGERFACERLFVATGLPHVNVPELPGVELCETYDRFSVDPEDFVDQRVFIVGKGNSAFETADALIETTRKIWICGPSTVRLAWATHYVGDLRAINNGFLDTYLLKAQNNVLDGELRAVWRDEHTKELVVSVYFESRKELLEYRCDRVLLCTGFRADFDVFAEGCRPKARACGRLPAMTCEWESVDVPGMFFAGTLMQSRDHRKTMSGFIHGFRHNIEALVSMIERRDRGGPWPGARSLSGSCDELCDEIIARLSTSAPMLLQPGFFCDAVIQDGASTEYLRDVPTDFAREHLLTRYPRVLLVTLEYREHDGSMNPFALPRGVGVGEDYYLHPVIRAHHDGAPVARFFLPDDLDNDWSSLPGHRAALRGWLLEQADATDASVPAP